MGLFSKRIKQIRIFLSSPGDVALERDIVATVVSRMNSQVGKRVGFTIDLVQWPANTIPGIGDEIQAVISRQIDVCEIYIFILWKRLGTPTRMFASGTVEEFEYAYKQWKANEETEVLVYVSKRPFLPTLEDLGEFGRVLDFEKQMGNRGVTFYPFPTPENFEGKLTDDLMGILLRRRGATKSANREPRKDSPISRLRDHRHFHGTLTDLLNHNHAIGLIHLDLDNFTAVREANLRKSEKLLESLVETIQKTIGTDGNLYRYAGDEFAVLVSQRPEEQVLELAERIRAA